MNATLWGMGALFVWSFFGVLYLFVRELPTFETLFLVFLIGYISFTSLQLLRRENIRSYWNQPWSYYIFWQLGAGLYTIIVYSAFKYAPVFEASILNYLWPILIVVFASLIYKEPLSLNRLLGLICGFAGMVAVVMPAHGEELFANFSIGHVLAVLGAIVWALYSVLTRNRNYPQGFQAPMFLILSVVCLVIHFAFEDTVIPSPKEWVFLFLLGSLRVSYVFWDYGMKKGNVILLTSLSYFLPLISSVFLIMAGEKPTHPLIALGAALIVFGCLVVNGEKLVKLLKKRA